ncbi:reductase AKOR2 [Thelephora ganbajun]|uniref:Reductase AKOR2 n=1 Tax=Thelephora ganbajun TaxID=370292 RepID=A0ACB6YZB1_THEGA|nr:reductase AKOR2 [Thelephora ganbajun]
MSAKSYTLNNGVSMPAIAFGGWGGLTDKDREQFGPTFGLALKEGFRHIDGAWVYRTEKQLAEQIRKSGIPREELFIATKLPFHHCDRVKEFFEDSLKVLGLDYIDLYLMHGPVAWMDTNPVGEEFPFPDGKTQLYDTTVNKTWSKMEELLETGKVRAIGVSNFSTKTLTQLLKTAKVVPAVNQVEIHPYLAQQELLDFCNKNGIHITAYSPTGRRLEREDPLIKELAVKYDVTPTQIILGWALARGVSIATQSKKELHRKHTLNLPELDPEDVKKITALDRKQFAYLQLDKYGTVRGWTPEQYGWEHLKMSDVGGMFDT